MRTLDLLSQVLFVGLMAMLLFVLYKRFIRMVTRDRLVGHYASVIRCCADGNGGLSLVIETEEPTECTLVWEGGQQVVQCSSGQHEHTIHIGDNLPREVKITFPNQVIHRKVG